jgi:hypothetical protein
MGRELEPTYQPDHGLLEAFESSSSSTTQSMIIVRSSAEFAPALRGGGDLLGSFPTVPLRFTVG